MLRMFVGHDRGRSKEATALNGDSTHWPGCWRAHDRCAHQLGVTRSHPLCARRTTQPSCVLPHDHAGPHTDTLGRHHVDDR